MSRCQFVVVMVQRRLERKMVVDYECWVEIAHLLIGAMVERAAVAVVVASK